MTAHLVIFMTKFVYITKFWEITGLYIRSYDERLLWHEQLKIHFWLKIHWLQLPFPQDVSAEPETMVCVISLVTDKSGEKALPLHHCPQHGDGRVGWLELGQGVWVKIWPTEPEVVRTRGQELWAGQETGARRQVGNDGGARAECWGWKEKPKSDRLGCMLKKGKKIQGWRRARSKPGQLWGSRGGWDKPGSSGQRNLPQIKSYYGRQNRGKNLRSHVLFCHEFFHM